MSKNLTSQNFTTGCFRGYKYLAIFGLFFFSFAMLATPVFRVYSATELENVGFVPANIWYSTDSPEEGETIRIYTFIFNNSTGTLTGTAGFYERSVLLGQKTFSVPPQTSKDIYINWKATPGDHSIHAEISDAKIISTSAQSETISLSSNKTSESKIFVPKTLVPAPADTSKDNDSTNKANGEATGAGVSLGSIGDILPENVSRPIENSISKLDEWREKQAGNFETLKKESKQNIDALSLSSVGNSKSTVGEKVNSKNTPLKPWEYTKYFFATLMSYIFAKKWMFYFLAIGIVFFFLKSFWKKTL